MKINSTIDQNTQSPFRDLGQPVKILLVDDRPENLLALEVILANKNYELVKATSGKEALKILLQEQDFALILMDALMPIMDGFETAEMIRENEKLKYVPIIFLTAQMNAPDNIFKGYQAGAVDYMLKPLSSQILKAKVGVFVDIYRKNKMLEEANELLKNSNDRFFKIFDKNPIGMTLSEIKTNKITYANSLFYTLFGYSKEETIGHTSDELKLLSPKENARLVSLILSYLKEDRSVAELQSLSAEETEKLLIKLNLAMDKQGFEVQYTRKNGELFSAFVSYEVIEIDNEKYTITSYQDITERKKAEQKALSLIEEKNKAEREKLIADEATKSKQQFLANMSHEIRTPMNAIIGFTKVILKTDLNEKQKEYLNAIKESGDSLIVLINDILDLAKVDSGKISFEKIPFKLYTSISSMLLLFDSKAKENNLELLKHYDDSIPEVLLGDPVRLRQIILNLLSNAIKFTNKGSVSLSVRLVKEDTESASIEFSVADTGIGIPENKIGSIFESFQQATSKTTRLFGGTGLGLAIVKQLVEAQHGTLTVKSKVGEGSNFSFIMSFKKTEIKIATETDSVVELEDGIKNVKILVAEDVLLNQLLMRTILEEFGFEIDMADNGRIALEKLQNNKYDIILMDVQMPEMDGFETTEHIRNNMNSKIPIIALTADVTAVDVERCKSVGMNDYLSKPVDEKLLYNKIVKYVKEKKHSLHNGNGRKEQHGVQKHSVSSQEEKCTNLDYLKQLTKGNPKMMMEMIDVYLEENPKCMYRMKQAIDNMDWELLKRTAHSIKPSFSTMGISAKFTDMVNKIQEYAEKKELPEIIKELFLKIEAVCLQAREELAKELISLEKL